MTLTNNTLTNSRVFPYASEAIFSRYSDASSLRRWWGPHGNMNIFESFDFREGGKWKFMMNDGKTDYPNEWIFRKIEKNHILMDHTVAPYFTLEVTLEELENNTTKMTWFSTWENTEFLMQIKDFLIEKNNENFDRLEEELKNF